jgi:hypothetical protein
MIHLEWPIEIIDHDEVLDVFRSNQPLYVEGKIHHYQNSKFKVICNVQPIGRDLLLVPEGDRYKEQYTIYAKHLLLKDNDRICRDNKNYQVQNVEDWGSYQKARIMLDDVGEYSND